MGEKKTEKTSVQKKEKTGGNASVIGGVMLATLAAKAVAIVRESVQANVFGTADRYYDAYNKTIYLFTTAAYAMCIAAVPIITKEMTESRQKGIRAANNLTSFSLLISLVFLGIWELLTISPFSQYVYGATGGEVIQYIRIMALSLPVIVAAYLMVSSFQAMDHFALQGTMSLPYSIFLILYLLILGKKLSLSWYVAAVAVAWVLQLAMSIPYGVKEKYYYRPTLDLKQSYIPAFLKTAVVTIITTSMYLFCYLSDASQAASMGDGVTSAFYYADKIFTPLTTTFIYSISAVMFPKFNRQYAREGQSEYKKYVWEITSDTLVVVLPVSALLLVFGGPILKVLFESGSFTSEATKATTEIFAMYVLGMAGFSVLDLMNKAFFTINKSAVPLAISVGVIVLNAILNRLFGANGEMVALMTAVSMTIGAAAIVFTMFRGEKIVSLIPTLKSLLASAVMGIAAYGLKTLLVSGTEGKILLILECCGIGVVAVGVFLGLSVLLRLTEITDVLARFRKNK